MGGYNLRTEHAHPKVFHRYPKHQLNWSVEAVRFTPLRGKLSFIVGQNITYWTFLMSVGGHAVGLSVRKGWPVRIIR